MAALMPRPQSADRLPTATLVNCCTSLANLFSKKRRRRKEKDGAGAGVLNIGAVAGGSDAINAS